MTSPKFDWARDSDPFFTFLGLYVATFQAIEGQLDVILLLEAGHRQRDEAQAQLVRMSNHEKVAASMQSARNIVRFPRSIATPDWERRVNAISARLHDERLRRNSILHSKYLLRGIEEGLAAIRTDRRRNADEAAFLHEEMTRNRMDQILSEIAHLAFDVGQIHIQLVHWSAPDN
jgi:hypothetical protein